MPPAGAERESRGLHYQDHVLPHVGLWRAPRSVQVRLHVAQVIPTPQGRSEVESSIADVRLDAADQRRRAPAHGDIDHPHPPRHAGAMRSKRIRWISVRFDPVLTRLELPPRILLQKPLAQTQLSGAGQAVGVFPGRQARAPPSCSLAFPTEPSRYLPAFPPERESAPPCPSSKGRRRGSPDPAVSPRWGYLSSRRGPSEATGRCLSSLLSAWFPGGATRFRPHDGCWLLLAPLRTVLALFTHTAPHVDCRLPSEQGDCNPGCRQGKSLGHQGELLPVQTPLAASATQPFLQ